MKRGVYFRPKFTSKDIEAFIKSRTDQLDNILLETLKEIAEEFVANARSTDTYKDRTSNLRGSIGYVIKKDGQDVFGNFEGETLGQEKARQMTDEIELNFPKGFVLVVVAGMEYAVYVEANGFDVLTSSADLATSEIISAFNKLKQRLARI